MHPIILVLLLGGNPQPAPPGLSGATIVVEDHQLRLPALPRNGMDARRHFKEVQGELAAAQATLGQYLAILGPSLLGSEERLRVPVAQADQAKALAARLQNDPFAPLLTALIQELKAWDEDTHSQAPVTGEAVVEQRKGGRDVLEYVPIAPGTPAGRTPIDDDTPGTNFNVAAGDAPGNATQTAFGDLDAGSGGAIWNQAKLDERKVQNVNLRSGLSRHDQAMAVESHQIQVARNHETAISLRWSAVLAQLDADARALAETLEQPVDPAATGMLELRRRVKLQLVERYQAVLRLCVVLWTRLGSDGKA